MSYNFIWSNPSSGAPIVSIASYGITFNSGAIQLLKRAPKVMIGYDNDKKIIGVKPVGNDESNAFPFAEKERKKYIRIASKDFVTYVSYKSGINIEKSTRYTADWDENEQILIIDLNKPIDNLGLGNDDSKGSKE